MPTEGTVPPKPTVRELIHQATLEQDSEKLSELMEKIFAAFSQGKPRNEEAS